MGQLTFQATLGGAVNLVGPNTASTTSFTLPSADGSSGQALTTNGSGTLAFGTLAVGAGGTGLTSTPANGALDIGNGTGFTRTTLTAGSNITITNGAGSISIAATGGGSPGGSSGQVQYNSSGSFAGSSNFNYDGSRLLLGLSSNLSSARLQVQGATDTAFTALTVNASTNDAFMGIGYSSSGSVWQIFPSYQVTAGYKPLAFMVGGSEVARFPTASGFQCVNSISVGNATPTTSGAGITFPATQSASTDANTLDDYEEGTVTPSVRDYVYDVNCSYTLSSSVGQYTKIGRQVTYSFTMTFATFTAGNGQWFGVDLPFTPSASTCFIGTLDTSSVDWSGSPTTICIRSYLSSGSITAQFGAMTDNAANSRIYSTGVSAGDTISGTITYFV